MIKVKGKKRGGFITQVFVVISGADLSVVVRSLEMISGLLDLLA